MTIFQRSVRKNSQLAFFLVSYGNDFTEGNQEKCKLRIFFEDDAGIEEKGGQREVSLTPTHGDGTCTMIT